MSPAFTRVTLLGEAKAEIAALTDPAVQKAALTALLMVERDLEFGRLLEVGATGDLRGCRKVYVDKPGPDTPRYRLVYWCAPSEAQPRRARVLAFGERKALDAYARAARRYNDDRLAQGGRPVETMTDHELGLD